MFKTLSTLALGAVLTTGIAGVSCADDERKERPAPAPAETTEVDSGNGGTSAADYGGSRATYLKFELEN